jgi:hypothetical protein
LENSDGATSELICYTQAVWGKDAVVDFFICTVALLYALFIFVSFLFSFFKNLSSSGKTDLVFWSEGTLSANFSIRVLLA